MMLNSVVAIDSIAVDLEEQRQTGSWLAATADWLFGDSVKVPGAGWRETGVWDYTQIDKIII